MSTTGDPVPLSTAADRAPGPAPPDRTPAAAATTTAPWTYRALAREAIRGRARALAQREDAARRGKDNEAVHDMRVAARRLAAALAVFCQGIATRRAARVARMAKRVRRALGATRVWDVHGETLAGLRARAGSDLERAAIEHAIEWVEQKRASERKQMVRVLGRFDLASLSSEARAVARRFKVPESVDEAEAEAEAAGGADDLARAALEVLQPRVDRAFASRPAPGEGEQLERLHAFRLALKKLRYCLELFAPAFAEAYAALIARVRGLQDLLGSHHDRAVLEELLVGRRTRLEAAGRSALSTGLALAMERLAAERRADLDALAAASADFAPERFAADLRRALGLA